MAGLKGYECQLDGWQRVVVPIPADMLDEAFQIRFAAGTAGVDDTDGVYIDDICIAVGNHNLCD